MKSSAKDYPTSLSTPIDRTAKQVVSKGVHFEPKQKTNTPYWGSPPPTEPVPNEYADLIGTKQDCMVIVGYLGDGILLARCACGKYEPRKASKWRKLKGVNENKCQFCNYLRYLKRSSSHNRTKHGR